MSNPRPFPPADPPTGAPAASRRPDGDPDTARRARLISGFGRLGCVAGVIFTIFYSAIGHLWGALVVLVCTTLLAIPLLLSPGRRLALTGNFYALVLTVGFSALAAMEGGLRGHAVAWLACVPLCACLLVNARSGLVWCAFCLEVVGVFSALACLGVEVPALQPPGWGPAISAAGYLALTLFMITLGVVAENSRRAAFQQLQSALAALWENNVALSRSLQNLRQSEGRFRILFENSALGAALLDAGGRVAIGNRRLAELLGVPSVVGLQLAELVPEPGRTRFRQLLAEQAVLAPAASPSPFLAGSGHEFTLRLPGGGGERRVVFFLGWIAETAQICALLDDNTTPRATRGPAAELEKFFLLDSLVGGIAHELNNKLTPVLGFSERLLAIAQPGRDAGEFAEPARRIHENAAQAAVILARFLQLTRPVGADLAERDLQTLLTEIAPHPPAAGAPSELTLSRGRRALVVDDEAPIAELIAELLHTNLDCEVEHFGTGEAALARLEVDGEFDLIVSDIRLPGISGFELLEWIREHRPALLPRVVVITGDAGSAERNSRLATLGVPVLLKPFGLNSLLEKCRAVLNLPARGAGA